MANRKVRRHCMTVPSGKAYKKLFCSYIICDYRIIETFSCFKSCISRCDFRNYSDKELYKMWYKDYKMK